MRNGKLKYISLVLAFVVLPLAEPGYAKGRHAAAHHGPAANDTGGGRSTKGNLAKPNPEMTPGRHAPAENPDSAIVTPVQPAGRPGITGEDVHGNPLIKSLDHSHQSPPSVPSVTVRNAIGIPVERREEGLRSGVAVPVGPRGPERVAPAAAAASLQAHGLANTGTGHAAKLAIPNPGRPVATVSTAGRIDGTVLIRHGLAPAGLGGPARIATGINGTTVPRKR